MKIILIAVQETDQLTLVLKLLFYPLSASPSHKAFAQTLLSGFTCVICYPGSIHNNKVCIAVAQKGPHPRLVFGHCAKI